MSRVRSIMNLLGDLKEEFESMSTYGGNVPVLELPRGVYNQLWTELTREGFMSAENSAARRGEDFYIFNFIIRQQT